MYRVYTPKKLDKNHPVAMFSWVSKLLRGYLRKISLGGFQASSEEKTPPIETMSPDLQGKNQKKNCKNIFETICARVDQLLVLGMGDLQPLIGNPCNGYVNPYYWVDDHPLLYGNNVSLDPGTSSSPFLNTSCCKKIRAKLLQ